MPYDYFYNQETEQYVHYQMPTILFEDERLKELSINAKFLYSLLLDRAKLSYKNGWLDNDGKVYIHFAQSELTQLLNCGRTKISEYFSELDGDKGGVGLIERKQKIGIGKNDKIYVKNFAKPINLNSIVPDTSTNIPYDYFHNMEGMRFSHYQIPKMLFVDERIKNISNTAKMAYSFLLDKTALSYKNGWKDRNGRIYVLFPQKELQQLLGCSIRTVKSALAELDINKGVGLIDRTKQGMNNPDMIYVLDYGTNLKYQKRNQNSANSPDNQSSNSSVNIGGANTEHQKVQNLNVGGAKSEHREVQILNIGGAKSEHQYNNNTDYSHTESNNTHSVIQSATREKAVFDRQTDGLKHEKMEFTDILTAIGFDWFNIISHEPESEKDFENYDEGDRKTKECTLPYNLKSDKKAMAEALRYLFAYSYYTPSMNEPNRRLLNTVISTLSEMCEKDKQKLDKETVRYCDIIDKINEVNYNYSLIDWFNSFEQKWAKIMSERGAEIKNQRAYLKSCIWNWLNDFQFDEDNSLRAAEYITGSTKDNTMDEYEIFLNAF